MVLSKVVLVARMNTAVLASISNCCLRTYSIGARDRYFTKKHEWVSVQDNVGTVGISDFAQEALGEVVFAQLPEVGTELSAGDEAGALESVKAAGEVYTPVSGTVTEKNEEVEKTPSLVNKSSMGDGWLFKLKLSKPEELKRLMDEATYTSYLKESH